MYRVDPLNESSPPREPYIERTDHWSVVEGKERVEDSASRLERLGNSAAGTRLRERYLDLLAPLPGEIVIDIGAGIGLVTLALVKRVAPSGRVFAVDRSSGLLDLARDYTHKAGFGHLVDYRVTDARSLPFGPAFDAAFCHSLLGHVSRPQEVVNEMRRVTRRGGRVLVVEPDWETAAVEPGETEITRRILNFAADRNLDPWAGRRVARYFHDTDLIHVTVEPIVLIDQGADRAWLTFLVESAAMAVAAGIVTQREALMWTKGLTDAFTAGTFMFALTHFAVIGRVPL